MRKVCSGVAAAMLILAMSGGGVNPAAAQSVEQFYKNKRINLTLGFNPGGGFDAYGRLVSRYLGKHVPGQPDIVVKYMPGAGSFIATKFLYNVADKGGTQIGLISSDMSTAPILRPKSFKFDSRKLTWLGSAYSDSIYCVAWQKSPIKSFKDVLTKEMVVGAAGIQMANVSTTLRDVIGAKFKIVKGYKGTAAVRLAAERGEIQGWCGVGLASITKSHPEWITNGTVRVLGQIGYEVQNEVPNVPNILDFAKNDDDRKMLKFVFSYPYLARPFVAPPGVPKARAEALRKAFADTIKDPGLVADAKRSNLGIRLVTGSQIDAFIRDAYATPKPVLARAAKVIARGKKKKKKKKK